MRPMNLPTYKVDSIIEKCADGLHDATLKIRLYGELATFTSAQDAFIAAAYAHSLFAVPEQQQVGDWIDSTEMADLYEKTFVRSVATRPIYEALRLSAPGGLCPLCYQNAATTLDHHLAKAFHPALSLTPANLVPACKDCNSGTNARRPATALEQTLHPYFCNVDSEVWLKAGLEESEQPNVQFHVEPSVTWNAPIPQMVQNHFEVFGLAKLYSIYAGVDLVGISYDVRELYDKAGGEAVKADLLERAKNRRKVVRNTWQAAMYQCLADSSWFCTGGFLKCL